MRQLLSRLWRRLCHFLAQIIQTPAGPRRPTFRPGCEALEAREVPASHLFVDGLPLAETKANYLSVIKYLTVPEARQSDPIFNGNDMAAIKKHLEDPLRREIVNAMIRNPLRPFNFADRDAAEQNVQIRVAAIQFMNEISHQSDPSVNTLHLDFSYYGPGKPPTANPAFWSVVPAPAGSKVPSREFQYQGNDAYSAIMGITAAPYVGECQGTAEITMLHAVAEVIGQHDFNELFPTGLWFGPRLPNQGPPENTRSVYTVLPQSEQLFVPQTTDTIRTRYMVPGDWVYMKNTPEYGGEYWNGENAIYMGTYDKILNDVPVWKVGATPRFSGLGGNTPLHDLSETQLRQDLWAAFIRWRNPAASQIPHVPANSGIQWTLDVSPGTNN